LRLQSRRAASEFVSATALAIIVIIAITILRLLGIVALVIEEEGGCLHEVRARLAKELDFFAMSDIVEVRVFEDADLIDADGVRAVLEELNNNALGGVDVGIWNGNDDRALWLLHRFHFVVHDHSPVHDLEANLSREKQDALGEELVRVFNYIGKKKKYGSDLSWTKERTYEGQPFQLSIR
jgi:hypothetical protein